MAAIKELTPSKAMRKLAETVSNASLGVEDQFTAEVRADELERQAIREKRVARIRLLWSHRQSLFRVTVVGLILSTVIAFVIPKRFQATTQLMPPDQEGGSSTSMALMTALSSQQGGIGAIAGDLLGIKDTGDLFMGVLRSRTVQDGVVERFNLKKEYGTRFDDAARQRLEQNTSVSEDRKSGIITLTVTDHDPRRAAAIAASYVDELNLSMVQLNTSSAHRERVFLEDRLSAVKENLEAAEHDLSQFESKNGTIDISEQGKAMVEGTAALQGQLIAAQSELQGLKQIYTDDNVRVRSTQARINELRSQLNKLGGRSPDGESQNASDDSALTLRQLPLLGVPYVDKFRQFKVEETVYETLTKQYEVAKVEEAKEIPSVKVLDPPEVPEHKSFPPRLLIMFAGTVCALIVGAIYTLGAARWRETDPQDPRRLLAQEIVGTVKARASWLSRNGNDTGASAHENLEQDSTAGRSTS